MLARRPARVVKFVTRPDPAGDRVGNEDHIVRGHLPFMVDESSRRDGQDAAEPRLVAAQMAVVNVNGPARVFEVAR